jgi:hypothetical protein
MCIMASPVLSVSDTRIFVGTDAERTRQAVVYAMSVQLRTRTGKGNAMILPVPVGAAGAGAVNLIDLSGVPNFFKPFDEAFIERGRGIVMNFSKGLEPNDALEVVRVGSYDVSIVPTVDDVKRLNRDVFDVSVDTEHTLREGYPVGFAFLVAQLRESGEFHPLAYTHPFEGLLFVPTRHEHGTGGSGDLAKWDHKIYYQGEAEPTVRLQNHRNWARRRMVTGEEASLCVLFARHGLVGPAAPLAPFLHDVRPVNQLFARGPLPNIDLTIPA